MYRTCQTMLVFLRELHTEDRKIHFLKEEHQDFIVSGRRVDNILDDSFCLFDLDSSVLDLTMKSM